MRRGGAWVVVLPGWNELMFSEAGITSQSIWLKLGRGMSLGMNGILLPTVCFDIVPGVGGGRVMMTFVFLYLVPQAEIGFSSWLPLGSGLRLWNQRGLHQPTPFSSGSPSRRRNG